MDTTMWRCYFVVVAAFSLVLVMVLIFLEVELQHFVDVRRCFCLFLSRGASLLFVHSSSLKQSLPLLRFVEMYLGKRRNFLFNVIASKNLP